MARKAPRPSFASRGKRSVRPSHASSLPHRRTCDCGSGLADLETIPSSGGVRACSRCYNRKHEAHAFTGGVAEHSDDPRDGSGWHYSRNPPQRYTITEGGRRARLAGGNVFFSKGEAQNAARFLRNTEGGDYKVRALKPGESVGRMAVANGGEEIRGHRGTETYHERWDRESREWWSRQPDTRLRSLYAGAWDANDSDTARQAVAEMKRRGFDTGKYHWPRPL